MFQDGRFKIIMPASLLPQSSAESGGVGRVYNTQWATFLCFFPTLPADAGLGINSKSDLKPFPFNNFTFFFTLFSKFFSSFHHCTCSLSVSRQYLALDGIYHPLGAAFPNNSTRRYRFTRKSHPISRGSHPLWRPVPRNIDKRLFQSGIFKLQLGLVPDFKFELLPLHSPLLRQSLLVSFPPLIDMLKFSG